MSKNNGGELGEYPNDKWRQFFEKFPEIYTLDVSEWKTVHVLAYFCKKYQEQYNVKYSFKFKSPSPPKSFEVFQVKTLGIKLSSNPKILRDYIDWVYQTKVVQAKRRLTSISFMTAEGVVIEYKSILLSGKKDLNVDRSTLVPAKYKEIFQEIGIAINSYGDLAFLFQMEKTPEMVLAFQKIKELGFDEEIVGRIV